MMPRVLSTGTREGSRFDLELKSQAAELAWACLQTSTRPITGLYRAARIWTWVAQFLLGTRSCNQLPNVKRVTPTRGPETTVCQSELNMARESQAKESVVDVADSDALNLFRAVAVGFSLDSLDACDWRMSTTDLQSRGRTAPFFMSQYTSMQRAWISHDFERGLKYKARS